MAQKFKFSHAAQKLEAFIDRMIKIWASDSPSDRKICRDYLQSVAMKTDLGLLKLLDTPSVYGDEDQVLMMTSDLNSVEWGTVDTTANFKGCILKIASGSAVSMTHGSTVTLTTWSAAYDPDNLFSSLSGVVTLDTAGIWTSSVQLWVDMQGAASITKGCFWVTNLFNAASTITVYPVCVGDAGGEEFWAEGSNHNEICENVSANDTFGPVKARQRNDNSQNGSCYGLWYVIYQGAATS